MSSRCGTDSHTPTTSESIIQLDAATVPDAAVAHVGTKVLPRTFSQFCAGDAVPEAFIAPNVG